MKLLPILAFSLLAAGCKMGGSVRELSGLEEEAFSAMGDRLQANEGMLRASLGGLEGLAADYAEQEYSLQLALSRAKLLESMRAPWTTVTPGMEATQRAVVLYHLYELELAEDDVLEARVAKRRESLGEVLSSYRRLQELSRDALDNLALLHRFLNQPRGTRITMFTETFLTEVTAFREGLATSENPRLVAQSEEVAEFEEKAGRVKERVDDLLVRLAEQRGE